MQNKIEENELFGAISLESARINEQMRADLDELAPSVDRLLGEVLEYGLFNGGKRVRPLLAVAAARLCGSGDNDIYKLACAFEYLHAATLFHDDIIDGSVKRRGKPSVHKKFGNTPAILAGDFLLALSMERIGLYAGQAGLKIFCRAAAGMVDGEFIQLRNAEKYELTTREYHEIIMSKTALLISAACEIGALFGGGDRQEQRCLRDYGMHLGCAFQITDDLLDYLGDPEKTGKEVGGDFFEGKMTLPIILALRDCSPEERRGLEKIIGDDSLRLQSKDEVVRLIEKNRGFQRAREAAYEAAGKALQSLEIFESIAVRGERRLLESLARYVVEREK
jgi:octaprenyl-diphosphate synthase